VIKTIESSGNQYAFRFEEKLYFHHKAMRSKLSKVIKRVKVLNNCSIDTALMILSTSWGIFQILGINIYALCGYDKSIIAYLMSPEEQVNIFYKFCDIQKLDLKKTDSELAQITNYYNEIEKKIDSKIMLITEIENELKNNKEAYDNLIKFIERYNGAKFLSNEFVDYLLRMINEARKYIKGVIRYDKRNYLSTSD